MLTALIASNEKVPKYININAVDIKISIEANDDIMKYLDIIEYELNDIDLDTEALSIINNRDNHSKEMNKVIRLFEVIIKLDDIYIKNMYI